MKRRSLLRASPALAVLTLLPTLGAAQTGPALPVLQVWKDPNCGCCKDWVAYLQRDGFQVQTFDTGNTAVRKRLGLPDQYGSCHTALIGGYVIEGHWPVCAGHAGGQPRHGRPGIRWPQRPLRRGAGAARWHQPRLPVLFPQLISRRIIPPHCMKKHP